MRPAVGRRRRPPERRPRMSAGPARQRSAPPLRGRTAGRPLHKSGPPAPRPRGRRAAAPAAARARMAVRIPARPRVAPLRAVPRRAAPRPGERPSGGLNKRGDTAAGQVKQTPAERIIAMEGGGIPAAPRHPLNKYAPHDPFKAAMDAWIAGGRQGDKPRRGLVTTGGPRTGSPRPPAHPRRARRRPHPPNGGRRRISTPPSASASPSSYSCFPSSLDNQGRRQPCRPAPAPRPAPARSHDHARLGRRSLPRPGSSRDGGAAAQDRARPPSACAPCRAARPSPGRDGPAADGPSGIPSPAYAAAPCRAPCPPHRSLPPPTPPTPAPAASISDADRRALETSAAVDLGWTRWAIQARQNQAKGGAAPAGAGKNPTSFFGAGPPPSINQVYQGGDVRRGDGIRDRGLHARLAHAGASRPATERERAATKEFKRLQNWADFKAKTTNVGSKYYGMPVPDRPPTPTLDSYGPAPWWDRIGGSGRETRAERQLVRRPSAPPAATPTRHTEPPAAPAVRDIPPSCAPCRSPCSPSPPPIVSRGRPPSCPRAGSPHGGTRPPRRLVGPGHPLPSQPPRRLPRRRPPPCRNRTGKGRGRPQAQPQVWSAYHCHCADPPHNFRRPLAAGRRRAHRHKELGRGRALRVYVRLAQGLARRAPRPTGAQRAARPGPHWRPSGSASMPSAYSIRTWIRPAASLLPRSASGTSPRSRPSP